MTQAELMQELEELRKQNDFLRANNGVIGSDSKLENNSNNQLLIQNIINVLPLRVFWKDKDLNYLGCNESFAKDAGEISPMNLIGKNDFDLVWKEEARIYREDDLNIIQSGKQKLYYEEEQTTPAGTKIWLRTSKVPLRDLAGNIIGILGMYEDITEHKYLESLKKINEELQIAKEKADISAKITNNFLAEITKQKDNAEGNEKKYRSLFESSNDAIILINNKCFFDCNRKAYELFQCEQEFIIGKEPHKFSPEFQPDGENSRTKADALFSKVNKGEPQVFDWQHIRPNGELFDVSVSLNLIDLNETKYMQAVLRDITEKKQIEKELEQHRTNLKMLVETRTKDLEETNKKLNVTNEKLVEKNQIIEDQNIALHQTMQDLQKTQMDLIQADKMASLGILTAGVAHEINNPLNYIMGGYVGLENYFIENPQLQDKKIPLLLSSIKKGIERATLIVKGLSQFSRKNENYNEECAINSIIDNCLAMLNAELENRIEVQKNYSNSEIIVMGNIGKLHQVFINLLINACQSIEKKGTISITTAINLDTVHIEITDTGNGISKENISKITDPFFTTKIPGKGTGLGLSITYKIVQDHGGKIMFQSELTQGTTVKLSLPFK